MDGTEFFTSDFLGTTQLGHEYHLVRWADHVGLSLYDRTIEAHAFLAASLSGGKSEPIDLPLTEEEYLGLNLLFLQMTQMIFGTAMRGLACYVMTLKKQLPFIKSYGNL